MTQEKEQNSWLFALFAISLAVSLVALCDYISIDSRSSFFQDDFLFLVNYTSVDWHNLFNPALNFGRPVTRDLYFFVIRRLLGEEAINYFVVNLAVIIGACWFLYRSLREFGLQTYVAATGALLYFYMAPTIPHASWISNSQHTFAHMFSFWFIYLMARDLRRQHYNLVGSCAIYILALFSNVSSLFALALIWIVLIDKIRRKELNLLAAPVILVTVLSVITLGWAAWIKKTAPSPYALNFSLSHIKVGLAYYDSLLSSGLFGSEYKWLFGLMVIFTISNFGAKWQLITALAAAFFTAFGMLFFLSDQRTLGYMAIPYLLFGLMFFANYTNIVLGRIRRGCLITLSFCFILFTMQNGAPTRDYFLSTPFGTGIESIQNAVRAVHISEPTTFCFAPSLDKGSNDNAFWIFLNYGDALRIVDYGDGIARRFSYYTAPECQAPDVVKLVVARDGPALRIVSTSAPGH